ncbi:MAG: aldo/keto reductase [Calditrichaeota bacterium]|nr:MAG: aldo/keto reductase [Calditrichota bacterium]MBL1207642.1 aldo/keto reductase [Calditrichota bacterium]NOG47475.1 aldo/keto reductase [Calditrichota bacterium]
MRYKLLGKSGLRVSEICLGTMTFGEEWGFGANKEESKKVFDTYSKKGGNFIDTANRYTNGTSEKYVGEFIKSQREHFVLATKYTLYEQAGDPNRAGNHRKNMIQSVEASLKRLNTEYIDVLYLHAWDFLTPVDEIMRTFDDLIRQGKIFYAAISDTPAWRIAQANTIANLRGLSPFIGLQVEYSLMQRTPERDLLPMAKAFDIGITAWAPIAGGALTGKYLKNREAEGRVKEHSQRRNERNTKIAEAVVEVAGQIGKTPAQVAIRWTMQQNQVVIPIVGARTLEQIEDNLNAADFVLNPEQMDKLNNVSKIEVGFPHDFLQQDAIKHVVYGDTLDQIDNHRS